MQKVYSVLAVFIGLCLFVIFSSGNLLASSVEKIDSALLAELEGGDSAEFLVVMAEQAQLDGSRAILNKTQKGQFVADQLKAVANATQPTVTVKLDELGVSYRQFYITNMILVDGDLATVDALSKLSEVGFITTNPIVGLNMPETHAPVEARTAQGIEASLIKINANDVWDMGYTGQDVVVAGHDTGYDWDHPALINQYRGWDGTSADHDYNWHDSIHSLIGFGSNPCGLDSTVPCDDNNHGTHTMGTMVGYDGGSNAIGVAPEADWISCRNMERGNGTPATYIECFEWFLAPYPIGGNPMTDGDPSKAPHVINNSWGCPTSEGCNASNFTVMETVVENLVSAGIVVVVSAGNSGPSCGSIETPAAFFDGSYTVGATNTNDTIAGFSSRGASPYSGSVKPDISAPGVDIRSAVNGGVYQSGWQGTSMAGPHVAGLVALMISANPALEGQVETIQNIINDTAIQLTTGQSCNGTSGSAVPNNTFGHGRIDALAAVNAALNATPTQITASEISASNGTISWLPLLIATVLALGSAAAISLQKRL